MLLVLVMIEEARIRDNPFEDVKYCNFTLCSDLDEIIPQDISHNLD